MRETGDPTRPRASRVGEPIKAPPKTRREELLEARTRIQRQIEILQTPAGGPSYRNAPPDVSAEIAQVARTTRWHQSRIGTERLTRKPKVCGKFAEHGGPWADEVFPARLGSVVAQTGANHFTLLSVIVAFTLFGIMIGLNASVAHVIEFARRDRALASFLLSIPDRRLRVRRFLSFSAEIMVGATGIEPGTPPV